MSADDPAACACGGNAVDAAARARSLKRLRLIEGQVRGIQGMIEDDRSCAQVLVQLAAVREALRSLGRECVRHHLRHCASAAIKTGGVGAEAVIDELLDMMRHS